MKNTTGKRKFTIGMECSGGDWLESAWVSSMRVQYGPEFKSIFRNRWATQGSVERVARITKRKDNK